MHKSSKTRWGSWSEWIWNEEHQRYYRQRKDSNGNMDYQWDPRTLTNTTTDEQTPRDYEDLTQGLQETHITPASPSFDNKAAEYTISSGGSSKPQAKSKSSSKSKSKASKLSSKSKGKAPVSRDDDEDTEQETSHTSIPQQPGQEESYYDPETGQYYNYPQTSEPYTTGTSATYQGSASVPTLGAEQYAESDYAQDEDPMIAAAIADSRRYDYSAHTAGESSSSAYGAYDYEDEGPATPRAGMSHTHISATEGEAEELDPRYRVELSHKFQPGEIFKVLWCEPQGSASEGAPSISDRFEVRDRFGGRIFVGFRRFIVIANDQGHCTCVPILTYGGKACNKRGVKPEKHGIVYEKGHKTRLLPGEPKLGFAPVKIQMTEDGEKLSKESRVNYSKLVTVEHNVKVLFIGRIVSADWDIVFEAVNKCWEEKIHHKRKHSDR